MSNRIPFSEIGGTVSAVEKWNPSMSNQMEPFNYIDLSSIDQRRKRIVGTSKIHPKEAPSRARQLVQEGDVLVSTVRPNLNGVAYVPRKLDGATASTGFCVLRPKEKEIDGRYLFYWVQTLKFIRDMVKFATGANYPAISDRIVKASKIPLPPMAEQKRITAILDKADAIRRKRRQVIQLADEFLRSVFLDMFGNLIKNTKGWTQVGFSDICESRLGKMLDSKKQTGNHKRKYLRNANLKWDYFNLIDLLEMDFDEKDRETFSLKYGDLLICEGGEVGRAAIWRNELPECYFQKALHRVRPKPQQATPEFLLHLLWFLSRNGGFRDYATTATIAHLTGVKLKEMLIPLPPLGLQQRFSNYYFMIMSIKEKFSSLIKSSQDLFASTSQRAFRGEL